MRLIMLCLLTLIIRSESYAQIPDPPIREADVMWSNRVWREIDLKEKINLPLYYPITASQGYESLFDVLIGAIKKDSLTAYGIGPFGLKDDFSNPLSLLEVQTILSRSDTLFTPDLDTGEPVEVILTDSLGTEDITRYCIKEDWIFDRQHSRMIVRIIGIAPLREMRSEQVEIRGYSPLFWIHLQEARPILAQAPVYLRHNDNHMLNYDDLFAKRFFHGHIVKSSNVFDRYIRQYTSGVDALLEGEAIEEEIRNFESDLWSH